MSRLCWPYKGHDPKVECSHYVKDGGCCEYDEQPCDNKMGHQKISSKYLDDNTQYVVLLQGADPGYIYSYINQIKVVAILNSKREVKEYRKRFPEVGLSFTKVGETV